ncbi:dynein axonemal heavy chain 2-like [Centruroides vittatus]|uniref:dynein axonemal heavy chain 2-like n=1 Tax=Centruroides vittatus TaxID=120091 RepID=UPI003510B2EF
MYAISTKTAVLESMDCCEKYKDIYLNVSNMHKKFSSVPWDIDEVGVFASIDAFIQRCKDVIEVCDCEMQFGRWQDGKQMLLPNFSGQKGFEITKNLKEIEDNFMHSLKLLSEAKDSAFDVWSTTWHKHYRIFRNSIQELERSVLNVIAQGFDLVKTVSHGLEILQAFSSISVREEVSRGINKFVSQIYILFNKELDAVKLDLLNKKVLLHPLAPKYSGMAHWAYLLLQRIQIPMQELKEANWLLKSDMEEDALIKYQQLFLMLKDFIQYQYNQWCKISEKESVIKLKVPLVKKSVIENGMLNLNFDRNIHKLIQEINYWEQMKFEIPQFLNDINVRKNDILKIRENVMVVIREYNGILLMLSPEEKGLFSQKIKFLDRKINPGITRLTWLTTDVLNYFVTDCKDNCSNVKKTVDKYKQCNTVISNHLQNLSKIVLFDTNKSVQYTCEEFKTFQMNFKNKYHQEMLNIYEEVIKIIKKLYIIFENDGSEVYSFWVKYVHKFDNLMAEALKMVIRSSLLMIDLTINGDNKHEINPLIIVKVILKNNKIELIPSTFELNEVFMDIVKNIFDCLNSFGRLRLDLDILKEYKDEIPSFKEVIMKDEDCIHLQNNISSGLKTLNDNKEAYCKRWEAYSNLWNIDMAAFIENFKLQQPSAKIFEDDINRYTELMNGAQKEDRNYYIQFLSIDSTPVKNSIKTYCLNWKNELLKLLFEISKEKLLELHNYMDTNIENLEKYPQTIGELQHFANQKKLKEALDNVKQQFDPLRDNFKILDNYNYWIDPELMKLLEDLNPKCEKLKSCVENIDDTVDKIKGIFISNLLKSVMALQEEISAFLTEGLSSALFEPKLNYVKALSEISKIMSKIENLSEQKKRLYDELNMLNYHLPPLQEYEKLEKTANNLEIIWKTVKEWEEKCSEWKKIPFLDLETSEIEKQTDFIFLKLENFMKSLDEKWEVAEYLYISITKFKPMILIVTDLKNPGIRPRHWKSIQNILGRVFNYSSPNFNIYEMITLGIEKHKQEITEIVSAATKELEIEKIIEEIKSLWKAKKLTIMSIKNMYHLTDVDTIFHEIDDNLMTITSIKHSIYAKPFKQEIHILECSLSLMKEMLEKILEVQKKCNQLQNIFVNGELRCLMPKEAIDFEELNHHWQTVTKKLYKSENALQITNYPDFLNFLIEMITKFESLENNLNIFLESKRNVFPRFYFVSNSDLFEMLSDPKNEEILQLYIKKCFHTIKKLKFQKTLGSSSSEALGLFGFDEEYVSFHQTVHFTEKLEYWACNLEKTIQTTLRKLLVRFSRLYEQQTNTLEDVNKKLENWLLNFPGQICILAFKIHWTSECTRALISIKEKGEKSTIRNLKKKQVKLLDNLIMVLKTSTSNLIKEKTINLLTVEVYARDIIEKLLKTGCKSPQGFEWLIQSRFYYEKENNACIVKQVNATFDYQYEYLGNYNQIVITPLTERCFITVTTALQMFQGTIVQGHKGTGKTETIKALAKLLGNYVLIINCWEGLDYISVGRFLSGVVQNGAWCIFDGFFNIRKEIMSVVSYQFHSVYAALSQNKDIFVFGQQEIKLKKSCGIFITVHPSLYCESIKYETVPDNVKKMFRPVAMISPDTLFIAQIILYVNGYSNSKALAKKVFALYNLSAHYLSKQNHYNFNLESLVALLKYAIMKKREFPSKTDEEILLVAIMQMNTSVLTSNDLKIFNEILQDIFPRVETSLVPYDKLEKEIHSALKENKLQDEASTVKNVLQLHQNMDVYQNIILCGSSGSGKSVIWKTLRLALNQLAALNISGFYFIKEYILNPKILTVKKLFGELDFVTGIWKDGLISSLLRSCLDMKAEEKWIIFDAPIDSSWIECMNSVVDKNKVLTLINGERIPLSPQIYLLFEVDNLEYASPSIVSQCGIVYTECNNVSWRTYANSWLEQYENNEIINELNQMFESFLLTILNFKKEHCKELVPITELNGVISLCKLLDCLISKYMERNISNNPPALLLKLLFFFSVTWSICASVDDSGRNKIDNLIRQLESSYPTENTVYDYYVDTLNIVWISWSEKLQQNWKYDSSIPFYKTMVPTSDTVRYSYLITMMLQRQHPILLVGPSGHGKTLIINHVINNLDIAKYSKLVVNFSSQIKLCRIQRIIESKVDKKMKEVYIPQNGTKMVVFIDDLNIPSNDKFGSQPSLELIRMLITYGFWHDCENFQKKYIEDLVIIAAMNPSGAGNATISARLLNLFLLINTTLIQKNELLHIFGSMLARKLAEFGGHIKLFGNNIIQRTIELYYDILNNIYPSPSHIHYMFSIRDIARVVEGLLCANKDYIDTLESFNRLWIHECIAVFSDRLVSDQDIQQFFLFLNDKLKLLSDQTLNNLCPEKRYPLFCDFTHESKIYMEVEDQNNLTEFLQNVLQQYNNLECTSPINLILFKDAIRYICRICHILHRARGNMLLLGSSGVGKQTLSKLSTYICGYSLFQIKLNGSYNENEFREDLKILLKETVIFNKPMTFLFADSQIVDEIFMENINDILCTGIIPDLFNSTEEKMIFSEIEKTKINSVNYSKEFLQYCEENIKANLHLIICMNPASNKFRQRIRNYPSLVNYCSINWFSDWPHDTLLTVATKYLSNVPLNNPVEEIQQKIVHLFPLIHDSVIQESKKIEKVFKFTIYTTPGNYMQMLSTFISLQSQKNREISKEIDKLSMGLNKLDKAYIEVENTTVELNETKQQLNEYLKECKMFKLNLIQENLDVKEQQKLVTKKSQSIEEEEIACKKMRDVALKDLTAALQTLNEASESLDKLDKKDIDEIRSYAKPPALIEKVMEAVMVFRGAEESWNEAKKQLGEANFIQELKQYKPERITDKMLRKISKYIAIPEFNPDYIGKVSNVAKSLCIWVLAMEHYGQMYRIVEPKRKKVKIAEDALKEKKQTLKEAKENLEQLKLKVEELTRQFELKVKQKESLENHTEELEKKLSSATLLVEGLSIERICWNDNIEELREKMNCLIGDSLLASAFLSYLGPFIHKYRDDLISKWIDIIHLHNLQCTVPFKLPEFTLLTNTIQEWHTQGLPSDNYNINNAIIIKHSLKWPFIIDPHNQATKWIVNLEKDRGLEVIDEYQKDLFSIFEHALQEGKPVLLQNVKETINLCFTFVLRKEIIPQNNGFIINFNNKFISYNTNFKLYITTKIGNPSLSSEMFNKFTVINFAVMNQGLESYLLETVVRKEHSDLEDKKRKINSNVISGRQKLKDLSDKILQLLKNAEGELLYDQKLIETLENAKQISLDLSDQLTVNKKAEIQIDTAREAYRPFSHQSVLLFSVLNEMNAIEPMYQFNLDAYIDLFILSIDRAPKDTQLKGRIQKLNEYHTFAVYKYADLILYEKHKLIFSFQICVKLMEDLGYINKEEYNFFITGGIVQNRKNQVINPCPKWLSASSWDNISELDNLRNFHGIVSSFEQISDQWLLWFNQPDPENHNLPGNWEYLCNKFRKILIVRCLRTDHIIQCIKDLISSNLGNEFMEPCSDSAYNFSSPIKPLLFILSSQTDPISVFEKEIRNHQLINSYEILSMDQNTYLIAEQLIEEGLKMGKWIFLTNCHNCLHWMPELNKIIEKFPESKYHHQFRLWLSTVPYPDFPITLLQKCIKITTEQPKGIKNNMSRLYSKFSEAQFVKSENIQDRYATLLFCLTAFHSILIERRYFKNLGWNVPYKFNDSDFTVAEYFLTSCLEKYERTSWDALKYFIEEIVYEGHVIDEWDKRLIHVYANECFCPSIFSEKGFKICNLLVPNVGNLASYLAHVNFIPHIEDTEIFGVHPNATITVQIQDGQCLLDNLIYIQPDIKSIQLCDDKEQLVIDMCTDILCKLPDYINKEVANKFIEQDVSSVNIALIHEIENYNKLLCIIKYTLQDLKHGLKGEKLLSEELEEIFDDFYQKKVPEIWKKIYPSLKKLGSWVEDLIKRISHFDKWVMMAHPPIKFWLSAFTKPKGFLTAVLQEYSKINKIPFDALSWDFIVSTREEGHITEFPEEGIYVTGIYIEGAAWDRHNHCLIEAKPMQLTYPFPVVNFKPTEIKKKKDKGLYLCPCYYYPDRMGTVEFPSFVIAIDVKSGEISSENWIKRGTAFLLNLDG